MLKVLRAKLGQVVSMRSLGYAILVLFILTIFFWHISSLTPGLSPAEVAARGSSKGLKLIYNNPINAPHKILQHFLVKVAPNSQISLKLATVTFAFIFGFCFYKLASNWFGKLIGLFGSLIFISMPLFIISSRQATAQIMLFSPIVLMWLYANLLKTKSSKSLAWVLLALSVGTLLYTPGLVWFVLICGFVCRRKLKDSLASVNRTAVATGTVALLLTILPLAVSAISHPVIIRRLFLIPADWPAILAIAKNTGWAVLALFIRTPSTNSLIIARLPIISVIVLALMIFGIYAMQAAARSKAIWLGATIAFSVLAAGVNNDVVYLALGIPGACLLASAGLRYLYIEWRAIFPRNPVPKTFALVLIAALTLTQVYFGVRYSLVAWPHSVATRSTYVLK